MKNLKQILVIVFMLMFTFAPEAQFYLNHVIDGHEAVIVFSPFVNISMASFWRIFSASVCSIRNYFTIDKLILKKNVLFYI